MPRLRLGHRRRNLVLFATFQFPNEQITEADDEWNHAQRPGSAFPIAPRSEADHDSDTYHHENNAAPHIGALAHGGCWRSEYLDRNGLPFLREHPDRAMLHSRFRKAEIHDEGNDQHRRAEDGQHRHDNNRKDHCRDVVRSLAKIEIVTVDYDSVMTFQFFVELLMESVSEAAGRCSHDR